MARVGLGSSASSCSGPFYLVVTPTPDPEQSHQMESEGEAGSWLRLTERASETQAGGRGKCLLAWKKNKCHAWVNCCPPPHPKGLAKLSEVVLMEIPFAFGGCLNTCFQD